MTEFVRAWMDSSFVVKLHFHILFGVVVVTLVRMVRLSLRRRQADSILVRSTRGLARASLFLSGGAAAAALNDALILFGTTSGSGVDTLVEQHRGALTLIAVSLGLCAFVYAAGLVMEVLLRGWPPRAHVDQRCARRATIVAGTSPLLRLAAIVLVSLAAARASIDVGMLTAHTHGNMGWAAYQSVQLLWDRLSIALFTCAVLSWSFVLLESAGARRAVLS